MSEGDGCVTVKLLFFAKARELSGQNETWIEVAKKITGQDLLDFIVTKFNLDGIRRNVILTLNENWVDASAHLNLHNQDEIAIIPPLSGEHGAVALFVGTTRNNFEGKTVEKLEYEAYDKMAIKSLDGICKKIREKFQIGNISIVHRLGDVPVQEASVVIAISAPHRKPVFEALSFAIDALKADAPIWKKEVYQGDISPQWKENAESVNITNEIIKQDCIQVREEVIEAETVDQVSSDLIQINTNAQEINRRIMAFIDRKRQQVNISNIEDFCQERCESGEWDSTCARTNAVLYRRKDSKTHLKVHRVENMTGPQIKTPESGNKGREGILETGRCPPGAEERIANTEDYLNVRTESLNVFKRLKAIEDKILYLESISPEYFDFARQMKTPDRTLGKKKYSSEDIDMRLNNLKSKFFKK